MNLKKNKMDRLKTKSNKYHMLIFVLQSWQILYSVTRAEQPGLHGTLEPAQSPGYVEIIFLPFHGGVVLAN